MKVLRGPWQTWEADDSPSSMTIGVFDGVHRGHRALIDRLDPLLEKTVLTFDPHPVEVLRPGTPPRLITTMKERLDLFETAGVQRVGVLDLAEIKDLAPDVFVSRVLVKRLGLRQLVLGPDFRFGRDRTGDVPLLQQLARDLGYEVDIIELVSDGTGPVSSSRIREMIESGRPAEAARELTTRFKISGTVIHGENRGAAIGYPTANVRPPDRKVIPATGVYAAFTHVKGETYPSAVNVGVRPTFGSGELLIESYIFDFDDSVYGEEITVEFVEYLRPELGFEHVDELVLQMARDVEEARSVLETTSSNVG